MGHRGHSGCSRNRLLWRLPANEPEFLTVLLFRWRSFSIRSPVNNALRL